MGVVVEFPLASSKRERLDDNAKNQQPKDEARARLNNYDARLTQIETMAWLVHIATGVTNKEHCAKAAKNIAMYITTGKM